VPKTDLKLYSKNATTGDNIRTSITYVNPNVANSVLKQFAVKLNNLTTNQYDGADKVETTNLDTAEDEKRFRNLTITGAAQGATATISGAQVAGTAEPPSFAVFYIHGSSVNLLTTTQIASDDPEVAKFTVAIPSSGSGAIFACNAGNETFYDSCARVTV